MTTAVTTLAEFLLARIAEEEAVARSVPTTAESDEPWGLWTTIRAPGRSSPQGSVEATPRRVLADCDAKRRIVEQHASTHECPKDGDSCGWWDGEPCDVLHLLALPYADHADYRDEWRP